MFCGSKRGARRSIHDSQLGCVLRAPDCTWIYGETDSVQSETAASFLRFRGCKCCAHDPARQQAHSPRPDLGGISAISSLRGGADMRQGFSKIPKFYNAKFTRSRRTPAAASWA